MDMLGIICGSVLLDTDILRGAEKRSVVTEYGTVEASVSRELALIQRHGKGVPPHKINHKANIAALQMLKATKVIAFSSVGSMKKELKPGQAVVIDDYMQLTAPKTFYDNWLRFTIPAISEEARRFLLKMAKRCDLHVHEKGVYAQTSGPRFETRAEVRMLADFADVVGMTLADEATLANEAGLPYAAICTIDNFANGLAEKLGIEEVEQMQKKSSAQLLKLIEVIADGHNA